MRFFPGRTQEQWRRLMVRPAPKVVWVSGSSEGCWGSPVCLHPIRPPLVTATDHFWRTEEFPKPTQANKWDFSKFLNMAMAVVTVMCVWWDIWCPCFSSAFWKDGQREEIMPSTWEWPQQSQALLLPASLSDLQDCPPQKNQPLGCFLSTQEKDLEVTCWAASMPQAPWTAWHLAWLPSRPSLHKLWHASCVLASTRISERHLFFFHFTSRIRATQKPFPPPCPVYRIPRGLRPADHGPQQQDCIVVKCVPLKPGGLGLDHESTINWLWGSGQVDSPLIFDFLISKVGGTCT